MPYRVRKAQILQLQIRSSQKKIGSAKCHILEGRKPNKNVLILNIADLWICDLQNLFADRPSLALKGVWHEIFDLKFFQESVSSWPLINLLGSFLTKIAIRNLMFIASVVILSLVSLLLVIHACHKLSPVLLTPMIKPCSQLLLIPWHRRLIYCH